MSFVKVLIDNIQTDAAVVDVGIGIEALRAHVVAQPQCVMCFGLVGNRIDCLCPCIGLKWRQCVGGVLFEMLEQQALNFNIRESPLGGLLVVLLIIRRPAER